MMYAAMVVGWVVVQEKKKNQDYSADAGLLGYERGQKVITITWFWWTEGSGAEGSRRRRLQKQTFAKRAKPIDYGVGRRSRLAIFTKHGIDRIECSVDLLTDLNGLRGQRSGTRPRHGVAFTFAPVSTILPDTNIKSTTLGLSMR